ncbi:hypothetical protein SRRS_38850 [Sporomusa rhizae]
MSAIPKEVIQKNGLYRGETGQTVFRGKYFISMIG